MRYIPISERLVFPEIKNFNELFKSVSFDKEWKTIQMKYGMTISTYCHTRDTTNNNAYSHLNVIPNDKVKDYIENEMLPVNGGVSFQLIKWEGNKSLVCVQYSSIIGSRYLAIIDSNTIPKEN